MLLGVCPIAQAVIARQIILSPTLSLPTTNLLVNGDFEAGSTGITANGFVSFSGGQAIIDDKFGDAGGGISAFFWDNVVQSGVFYTIVLDVASVVRGSVQFVMASGVIGTGMVPVQIGQMTFINMQGTGSQTRFGLQVSTNAKFTLNGVYLNLRDG